MPGRRHKSFRSGDLNEELGILLLKGVAAVAAVSRPEDVGVDAIATLLRDGGDNLLYAENSFYVQLKSASDETIAYKGHEVRWLEGLKLPFFIGSVDKQSATISIYAAHRLTQVLIENAYETIELVLNPDNKIAFGVNPKTEGVDEGLRRVDIGPPLLRWGISDLSDGAAMQLAYDCLKPYLIAEQRNIDFRAIRYYQSISWRTGEVPKCDGGSCLMHGSSTEEMIRVMKAMWPCVLAMGSRAHTDNNRNVFRIVLQIISYMRSLGYDPDPHGTHQTLEDNWDRIRLGGQAESVT